MGYTMVGVPAHGTLAFNPNNGLYAYTPTQSARLAADQATGPDTDSFIVTVSDARPQRRR